MQENLFYCDDNLLLLEKEHDYKEAISYLFKKFEEEPTDKILSTIIGDSWYYLTEECRDDCDYILWNFLLEAWKKSISLGEKNYKNSQIVNFIIGYTLYFDWIMLLDKEPACNQILMRAISLEPTSLLAEFITLFIKKSATHKYSQKFCSLFAKQSLLDNYFRSIYCNDK